MIDVRRFSHDDAAVSAVEFALIAPIVFMIMIGILDFSRAMNAYVTVGNAAREGTHYLAAHPTAAPSAVVSAVRGRVVPLDPTQVTVTASFYDGSTFQPWPSSPTANSPMVSTPIRVTVSYPWTAVTFISQFFPDGAGATFVVSSTVDVMR